MLANMLYLRFCTIYGHKFSKGHTDELIKIWCSDWSKGISGIDEFTIKKSVDHCLMNLEWPPSIAEFRKICEEVSGILSVEQIIDSCIRRDLSNPMVEHIFQTVTSWAFSHEKESELIRKVKSAREEYLLKYRMDCIKQLAEKAQNSPMLEVVG